MNETERRVAFINGLRELASFLEATPGMRLDIYSDGVAVSHIVYTVDEFRQQAALLGDGVTEEHTERFVHARKRFGYGASVDLLISRATAYPAPEVEPLLGKARV